MDEATLTRIILGAKQGNPASFDELVDAYSGRIFGFLYRLTGSRHDAEDLMQEVFVRLVRMIGAYEHDGRFEAWLFRIAANLARDRLRRVRRTPKQLSTSVGPDGEGRTGLDDVVSEEEMPDAGLVRAEDTVALNAALAELPEAEREVILLRHYSEMSFNDIAEAMGTPLGTALARAHRGLKRLRKLMAGQDEPAAQAGEARPG